MKVRNRSPTYRAVSYTHLDVAAFPVPHTGFAVYLEAVMLGQLVLAVQHEAVERERPLFRLPNPALRCV